MGGSKAWGSGSWKGGAPLREWGWEWEQGLCLVTRHEVPCVTSSSLGEQSGVDPGTQKWPVWPKGKGLGR